MIHELRDSRSGNPVIFTSDIPTTPGFYWMYQLGESPEHKEVVEVGIGEHAKDLFVWRIGQDTDWVASTLVALGYLFGPSVSFP